MNKGGIDSGQKSVLHIPKEFHREVGLLLFCIVLEGELEHVEAIRIHISP